MLYNPENRNISIHKYVTIMVIYHPFINSGLSKSNSQHSILDLNKDKDALLQKEINKISPTTMLEYLVIDNSGVTAI